MKRANVLILASALSAGQLIRIPFAGGSITILDATIIFFCLWGLLKIKFKLQRPPIQIITALTFFLIAIVSLVFTPLSLKLSEYLNSFSYIARFSLYILISWLIFTGTFDNLKNTLKDALLLSGISFAVLGLVQFIFFPNLDFLTNYGWDPHFYRTVSAFLDPNFAGAFLVLTLILLTTSYLGGLKQPTLFQRVNNNQIRKADNYKLELTQGNILTHSVFYLFFALTYLALLTTFSRSSYLMFLVSGLSFSLLKKSGRLILVTLILFAVLLLGFRIYTNLVSKPRNIDRAQSASFRLNTWQQGLEIFQKNPILGTGFNTYRYAIREYNLGDQQFLNSHGSTSNDSSLLFVASTTGIIGLTVFFCFLFSLCIDYSNNRYTLIPAVLGLLIHSVFANSLFYPPILVWILLISAAPKN